MDRLVKTAGTKAKLGLGALALAVVALPAAGALASAEDPTAALSAEQVDKGRQLFTDNGCNACHALADAKAAGSIGPALDGNGKLDKAYIVNIVTNGQGAMPSYGWLGEEDIDVMASYIVHAKK
ncbi:MAG TPA: cytochrome c [Croceibacterium sp.]|nr:cytochrome c [Croceibacterium sp.]